MVADDLALASYAGIAGIDCWRDAGFTVSPDSAVDWDTGAIIGTGIGGADTINGAGMTGTLYFDAGTGADRMTGGSGHNIYEYAATSDSTVSAMDIISNFNTATDRIDLTGLSSRFSSVAALSTTATTLAAGAIGWQVSGGNTFVYANTSGRTESLGSTNMKIELQGAIALTAANISHN